MIVVRHIALLILSIFFFSSMYGCGAMHAARTAIENKDTTVDVSIDDPVFISLEYNDTISIQVDDQSLGIAEDIRMILEQKLVDKGFKVVPPQKAGVIGLYSVRVNQFSKSARELHGPGDLGAVAGFAGGLALGARNGDAGLAVLGALTGAVAGGTADLSSSMVRVKYYDVRVDYRIEQANIYENMQSSAVEPEHEKIQCHTDWKEIKEPKVESGFFTVHVRKMGLSWDEARKEIIQAVVANAAMSYFCSRSQGSNR